MLASFMKRAIFCVSSLKSRLSRGLSMFMVSWFMENGNPPEIHTRFLRPGMCETCCAINCSDSSVCCARMDIQIVGEHLVGAVDGSVEIVIAGIGIRRVGVRSHGVNRIDFVSVDGFDQRFRTAA